MNEPAGTMTVDYDVGIEMDDGIVLKADVFRPLGDGSHPVILTYGPYGKGMPFQMLYADQWRRLVGDHPEVTHGTSCRYQNWEVVDPELWVPAGYVCVRVDSRGAGRSPGHLDIFSPRETRDYYNCIEWAGTQPWSNGRVGLNGISYYAINQWLVASLQPPHLAAMCAWEGAADAYRDWHRHGGILSTFTGGWFESQILPVQNGVGSRGERDPNSGFLVAGPETLSDDQLAMRRTDPQREARGRELDDSWYRERSPDWEKVTVPFLSAGSWGGAGLHLRGNTEAFVQAASPEKWLELHGLEHWTHFYTEYGMGLQMRFFDHYLKDEDNGWEQTPPVILNVRSPGERFETRYESAWPLDESAWTELYLDADNGSMGRHAPESNTVISYNPSDGGSARFVMAASDAEMELTGPLAAKLFVSTDGSDADLFVVVQLYDDDGREVTFAGSVEPAAPIAQGWLRLSHRSLDSEKSEPYRPYHPHDEFLEVTPEEIYEVDVEIWPTCIVVPPGYQLAVTIQGSDLRRDEVSGSLATLGEFRGCGPFQHNDPWDRRPERFSETVTIHTGPNTLSHLLVPVIG